MPLPLHRSDARLLVAAALLSVTVAACGSGSPTTPTPATGISFTSETATGSTIQTTQRGIQYFIDRGSGQLSIALTIVSPREVPYAALWLYLNTADGGYCGQNLPDAPTWGPFPANQPISVTITGWQVGRTPCDVVGVHAFLHTRNNGNLTPPIASETVVDATLPVTYHLR